MMYVVKVGGYYVKSAELKPINGMRAVTIGDILLSKEIMKNFDKNMAEMVANKVNGKVVEIAEEVTINDN